MGLFRNRGGSATVQASLPSAEVGAGESVELRYEVAGALDDQCRGLLAGLTCVGTYITPERGRDASGHPIERDVAHEVKLHDDQRQLPLAAGEGSTQFNVPRDADPSSADAVAWQAWVQIDRGDGKSPIQRVPFAVRTPPAETSISPDVTNAGLTLRGIPSSLRAGDAVTGTLIVNVDDDVKASDVVVRLNRRRTYIATPLTADDGGALLIDTARARGVVYSAYQFLGVVETNVFGRQSFAAGTPAEASFSLTLPGDAGPSTRYPYGQVDWWLEAVLNRRLHDDLTVTVPITVT